MTAGIYVGYDSEEDWPASAFIDSNLAYELPENHGASANAADAAHSDGLAVPKNYKEAMASLQADQWKQAMDREMESQQLHGTFQIVKLPPGRKAIPPRWVYDI
jgi:hypothetical protein